MMPFSHVFSCAVRWGDMDAYGHVNHAQFLRYLESARIALFEDLCGAMVALPLSGGIALPGDCHGAFGAAKGARRQSGSGRRDTRGRAVMRESAGAVGLF